MRHKIWVRRARSFEEAERFDDAYYQAMSRVERLETIQFLRETYDKIKKDRSNACAKGLRRAITIIQ